MRPDDAWTDSIHIADLEAALGHWQAREPRAAAALALAEVLTAMQRNGQDEIATEGLSVLVVEAWLAWYATTPDTPCIAICSTSQGDASCRGCGRTEQEVHEWLVLSPFAKRKVWRRITGEGKALRFNGYAERARLR